MRTSEGRCLGDETRETQLRYCGRVQGRESDYFDAEVGTGSQEAYKKEEEESYTYCERGHGVSWCKKRGYRGCDLMEADDSR